MDIDSGDDIWGAGEYKTKDEVDDSNSENSNLTAMGYHEGDGGNMNGENTESTTSLFKSVLIKGAVTLLGFLVLVLLLFLLLG